MTHDMEYYRRREMQERDRAANAEDNGARKIHREMADRYAAMLSNMAVISPVVQL